MTLQSQPVTSPGKQFHLTYVDAAQVSCGLPVADCEITQQFESEDAARGAAQTPICGGTAWLGSVEFRETSKEGHESKTDIIRTGEYRWAPTPFKSRCKGRRSISQTYSGEKRDDEV